MVVQGALAFSAPKILTSMNSRFVFNLGVRLVATMVWGIYVLGIAYNFEVFYMKLVGGAMTLLGGGAASAMGLWVMIDGPVPYMPSRTALRRMALGAVTGLFLPLISLWLARWTTNTTLDRIVTPGLSMTWLFLAPWQSTATDIAKNIISNGFVMTWNLTMTTALGALNGLAVGDSARHR